MQRPVINYRDTWTAGISRFGPRRSPTLLEDACSIDGVPARMIADVGDET